MPLGLMPELGYEQKEIALQKGNSASSTVTAWSRPTTPKGEMFGFPRLRALVAEHGKESAGGDAPRGALHLRWGGLGAGGRHNPSIATRFRTLG
jgi:hypothetical protein